MDLLALPPELLAAALSRTDGQSVASLLCTARSVCRHVRSLRDALRLENAAGAFVRGLPRITGQKQYPEVGTEAFVTVGPGSTTRHVLHGRRKLTFPHTREQFTSIRVPTALRSFWVEAGGVKVLRCDAGLLRLLDQGDGHFEAMALIRHLPTLESHWVTICCHTGPEPAALYTTMAGSRHWQQQLSVVRWPLVQVAEVVDAETAGRSARFRLFSGNVSLGYIVSTEHEGTLVTDLAETFTLGIRARPPVVHDMDHAVPAPAVRCGRVQGAPVIPAALFDFPCALRDCYFIPTGGRIDGCMVEALTLKIDLFRPAVITTRVWAVHLNAACTLIGMFGLRYSI